MAIYTLVEASTRDDAIATGKTVFDRLVSIVPHVGAVFDCYVTFNEDEMTVTGTARWSDLPAALPWNSTKETKTLA